MSTESTGRNPVVSVCIPTFNRAAKLKRAIAAVLASGYPSLEIIVSDNASTDDTQATCEALVAAHANIRYFRHSVNRGMTQNFKFAREQATGEYFLWHGDDDELDPDFIRSCVTALESNPSLSLACGRGAYHRGDHVTVYLGNIVESKSRFGIWRALHFAFCVEEGSMFCGLYRSALVRDCDMPNCLAGDWIWLAQVLAAGKAEILRDRRIFREYGANTSISFDNIVRAVGAPRWHARFPWLAMPLNLANYMAFESATYRGKLLPVRMVVWSLFFGTLFAKQAILALVPKIPFGPRWYRRVFLDD